MKNFKNTFKKLTFLFLISLFLISLFQIGIKHSNLKILIAANSSTQESTKSPEDLKKEEIDSIKKALTQKKKDWIKEQKKDQYFDNYSKIILNLDVSEIFDNNGGVIDVELEKISLFNLKNIKNFIINLKINKLAKDMIFNIIIKYIFKLLRWKFVDSVSNKETTDTQISEKELIFGNILLSKSIMDIIFQNKKGYVNLEAGGQDDLVGKISLNVNDASGWPEIFLKDSWSFKNKKKFEDGDLISGYHFNQLLKLAEKTKEDLEKIKNDSLHFLWLLLLLIPIIGLMIKLIKIQKNQKKKKSTKRKS